MSNNNLSNEQLEQTRDAFRASGRDDLAETFGQELRDRDDELSRAAQYRALLSKAEERGLMDEPEFQAIQQRLETIREESGAIEVSANAALAKRTPVSDDVAEQLDEGQAAEAQERLDALAELADRREEFPGRKEKETARDKMTNAAIKTHFERLEEIAQQAGLDRAALMPDTSTEEAAAADGSTDAGGAGRSGADDIELITTSLVGTDEIDATNRREIEAQAETFREKAEAALADGRTADALDHEEWAAELEARLAARSQDKSETSPLRKWAIQQQKSETLTERAARYEQRDQTAAAAQLRERTDGGA